jgi:formylglycine-generating enzyme required for sulfatase activity
MKNHQPSRRNPAPSTFRRQGVIWALCSATLVMFYGCADSAEVQAAGPMPATSKRKPREINSGKSPDRTPSYIEDGLFSMVEVPGRVGYQFGSEALGTTAVADVPTFLMATTETTQRQWREVMGKRHRSTGIGNDRPVETVSWNEAARFCNKLSDRRGLERCYTGSPLECRRTKNGYRLPSAAEWSLACFGEATTIYPWGSEWDEEYCASPELKGVDGFTESHSVQVEASKPNPLGLHDLSGNVSEWCDDSFDGQPHIRVYRGGNRSDWTKRSFQLHWSAGAPRTESLPNIGFRVVRNLNGGR